MKFKKEDIICVIPARGNSKGIKKKIYKKYQIKLY